MAQVTYRCQKPEVSPDKDLTSVVETSINKRIFLLSKITRLVIHIKLPNLPQGATLHIKVLRIKKNILFSSRDPNLLKRDAPLPSSS